jgi:methyl-accepting chemotaxis protein
VLKDIEESELALARATGLSRTSASRVLTEAVEIAYQDGKIRRRVRNKCKRNPLCRAALINKIREGYGRQSAAFELSSYATQQMSGVAYRLAEELGEKMENILDALSNLLAWIIEHKEEILEVIKFISMLFI